MAKVLEQKKFDALVKFLKSTKDGEGFGQSYNTYCQAAGIEYSEIGRYLYKAELEADPKLKVPATSAGIRKAAEAGHRWPRIAAYAGVSVAQAQKLYEEATGQSANSRYSGRGRKFDGSSNGATTSGSTSGTTRSSGTKAKAKTATSGRRTKSEAKKTSAAPGRRPGRRTSRAAATASDPK